ncbi:hypothetical protein GGP51_002136 [Salinibacter ruber]|nr:hypothetical protein [Salinibacter ruber]MCS4183796.1 hypothetical protein [Salinibacter ruber]MCS4190653.1 hypothetical protein [Salinibacter ruber]
MVGQVALSDTASAFGVGASRKIAGPVERRSPIAGAGFAAGGLSACRAPDLSDPLFRLWHLPGETLPDEAQNVSLLGPIIWRLGCDEKGTRPENQYDAGPWVNGREPKAEKKD